MNASNFIDFIEHPDKLSKIPYEELKTLVVQYPYCQHLRLMLYLKSDDIDHRDNERNLHLAATYSFNRRTLHELLSRYDNDLEEEVELLELIDVQETELVEEEILELKELEQAEATKDEVSTPQAAKIENINELFDSITSLKSSVKKTETIVSTQVKEEPLEEEILEVNEEEVEPIKLLEAKLEETIDLEEEEKNEISDAIFEEVNRMSNKNVTDLIEEEFSSKKASGLEMEEDERLKKLISAIELKKRAHIERLNGTEEEGKHQRVIRMLSLKKQLRKKIAPKNTQEQKDFSTKDDSDFFSKTLAKLLASQGRPKKAIKMYQQLMESDPSNKETYQKEIEKLEE